MLGQGCQSEDLKDQVQKQWNRYAPSYNQRVGYYLTPELKQAWKKELVKATDWKTALSVLDIGTGPGFLAMLFEELGHDCLGIDFSFEMIRAARQEAEKNQSQCRFAQADAELLPFKNDSFDIVTNRHVIWTLTEPQKSMNEWVRVLKPGGRIIIFEGNWFEAHLSKTDRMKKTIGEMIIRRKKAKDKRIIAKISQFNEIKQRLPMRSLTKEKVADLMKVAGISQVNFQDISNLIKEEIKARPLEYQLTYNKNRFLVVGQKEPEDLLAKSNEGKGIIGDGERKSIDCTVDNRPL